ncbi:MAG: methyltransferase domain-containing protein [Syntrophales bacterium]
MKQKLLFSPFFYISRCINCGYGAYDRRVVPELLEAYYSTGYWQAQGLSADKWHQTNLYREDARAIGQYRCIRNWVEKFDELNVLEIGAGSAFFSRLLKDMHPGNVHLNVIEAGVGWEAYYKAIHIQLISKYFPCGSNHKFHYVHTSHWLEHVPNVDDALDKIRGMLTDDGLLFIEVPNCGDEYYLLDNGDTPHISFFTRESLTTLLEKKSFKTLAIDEYGLTFGESRGRFPEPDKFAGTIHEEGKRSERENIPRAGGYHLRALFQAKA